MHFRFSMLGVALLILLPIGSAWCQTPQHGSGSSSKRLMKDALAAIPYQEFDQATAKKIADVVDHPSIYRQLPLTVIQSDPDLYLFLIRYPEVIISTWRLMGVTQMAVDRTAPFELQSDDGAGTTMDLELVYGTPTLNIYYADGAYDGPMLFRKIQGQCVLVLQSEYGCDAQGNTQVTSCLHVFLKINNVAANLIAKTLHPLVGSTADHNFVESLSFLEKLSNTSQENGPGVQGMADRLEGLCPEVRKQFKEIAGIAYERTLNRPLLGQGIRKPGIQQAGHQQSATTDGQPIRYHQGVISDQPYQRPAARRRQRSGGRSFYPSS